MEMKARLLIRELGDVGDLTGFSAVLFGDAASPHGRDLAMAVEKSGVQPSAMDWKRYRNRR
jgi:hypothetical protein